MDTRPGENSYDRLREAEQASSRAQDLTQQLLTFSLGGAPIKKTISLGDLLKETVTFSLRGTKTRCVFDIPEDVWPVEADEGQLSQVFNNLAINADQAMPEGGILKVACVNAGRTDTGTLPLPEGRYVVVSFIDEGIGIPREHVEKIFDPYFTTKQKGSGLGLATSYSIIKRHSGHISAESELGAGSTVRIYLPASEVIARKTTAEEAAIERGSGSILIVDDEEMIRDVASKILIRHGYEVATAEDGQVALEVYARARTSGRPFDAVVLDLTIPGGMGGREAIGKLLELDPKARVIVSSGYSNDPIMAEFREHGFSGVVSKPYTIKKLSDAVRAVLGKNNVPST